MGGRGGHSHFDAAFERRFGDAKNFLTKAYGPKHAKNILLLIKDAPEYIKDMWEYFAYQFQAAPREGDIGKTGYYSANESRVHLDIKEVASGVKKPPYATVFHEYAHMVDNLSGRDHGLGQYGFYSEEYKNGLLGKTAKMELAERVEGIKSRLADELRREVTWDEAARTLIKEVQAKYSKYETSDLSDIMEGAGIGIAYPLYFGHDLDYWDRVDNGIEIFAEISSASAAHPRSLEIIKEYFPETYKVYLEMMNG